MNRRIAAILMACLALSEGARAAMAAQVESLPEDELKAAAILSFLRFTEWRVSLQEPLVVGLVGRPRFQTTVARTLAGKIVGGRPVIVRPLRSPLEARECHVVYVATGRKQEIVPLIDQVRGLPVLLVGESDNFLDLGGAISLFLQDGRLNFEVSLVALHAAGTTISAKLLRLGQIRRSNGPGGPP